MGMKSLNSLGLLPVLRKQLIVSLLDAVRSSGLRLAMTP